MAELFTEEWVESWGRELRRSEEYREAAQEWEGAIVFELRASQELDEDRAVFLDLLHGDCRHARLAADGDREGARYVVSADLATWRTVLDGTISVLPAIMRGKLRLRKGKLSTLMPFTAAARELLAAATRIETELPRSPEDLDC